MRTTSATTWLVALGIALVAVVTTSGGVAPAVAAPTCSGDRITVADLGRGCVVSSGTVTLPDGRRFAVPAPGTTVSALPLAATGSTDAGDVAITNTGRTGVAVSVEGRWSGSPAAVRAERARSGSVGGVLAHPSAATTVTTTPTSSCSNRSYALLAYRWGQTVRWSSNPAGARTADAAALRSAANAWTGTIKVCGRSIPSGVRNTYLGTTTKAPAVSATGGCGAANGASVTGWGPLRSGTLATTCVWSRNGAAIEVDQRYATGYAWSSSATCSGTRYDLRGVATHEWGHAYGLGHVAQSSGLVMKPASTPCDVAQRTLGLGDAFGIDVAS